MITSGYETHAWLRGNLQDLSRTSLPLVLAYVLVDHLIIILAGILAFASLASIPIYAWLPLYALLAVASARQIRGLECLVHEGSHYNWTRAHKQNDRYVDVLAAWPVLSQVHSYRNTHLVHHRLLGTDQDTDLIRWQRLNLDGLCRDNAFRFTAGLLRRVVPYVPSWWWAIGVDVSTTARFLMWHAVLVVLLGLAFGPKAAILIWLFGWGIPLFAVLPVLRFIGEIEEHNYPFDSIMKGTNTNIGFTQTLLLHPHGDGYHTLHHLYPTIPFYRVAKVHAVLMKVDSKNYGTLVPVRRRIMDNVGR